MGMGTGFRALRFWNTEVLSDIEAVKRGDMACAEIPIPILSFPLKGKEPVFDL